MSPELAAYVAHLDMLNFSPKRDWAERKRLRALVPRGEYEDYRKGEYLKIFEAGAPALSSSETVQLHGKEYTLETWHTTDGGWGYSQGRVFAGHGGPPIAVVTRNYSGFPALFVAHPNGHAYLVCGWDYQGQTVIELDTGKRRDFLPVEGDVGVGFCWAGMTFDEGQQMLIVDGCIWAAPYEYRFYDFSNPLAGWPEIPCFDGDRETMIDADARPPTVAGDQVTTYQTRPRTEEEEDREVDPRQLPVVAYTVFRRDGLRLVRVRAWVSEEEAAERARREEAAARWHAEVNTFKETDPLYLAAMAAAEHYPFKKPEHIWIGQTFDGWCPFWKGEERRYGFTIAENMEMEFGDKEGPLHLWVAGDPRPLDLWFPRSLASLEKALREARLYLEAAADVRMSAVLRARRAEHPELWGAQR